LHGEQIGKPVPSPIDRLDGKILVARQTDLVGEFQQVSQRSAQSQGGRHQGDEKRQLIAPVVCTAAISLLRRSSDKDFAMSAGPLIQQTA